MAYGNPRYPDTLEVVWDDLRIVPGAFQFPGGADPVLRDWQPGGSGTTFKVWCFSQGDYVEFSCQLPHGYKLGTTLYPHLHWTPREYGAAENGNQVSWQLDYSIANLAAAFGASATVSLADACGGTNHKHQLTASGTISGAGLTQLSTMIMCRLSRSATADTFSNVAAETPAILEFDIHYQIDSVGSRTESTK